VADLNRRQHLERYRRRHGRQLHAGQSAGWPASTRHRQLHRRAWHGGVRGKRSDDGQDLIADYDATTDKLTIENWYLGSSFHVEQFKTADGKLLLDSQVENLVQAMAAFAPPAAGQTTLPPTYQDALAPVIAANWQ